MWAKDGLKAAFILLMCLWNWMLVLVSEFVTSSLLFVKKKKEQNIFEDDISYAT